MSRSLYKGVYLNNFLKQLIVNNRVDSIREITTRDRSNTITPQFVGKRIFVYNGKDYHSVMVTSDMIGHKFGEFVGTRKRAIYKKKAAKKKNK